MGSLCYVLTLQQQIQHIFLSEDNQKRYQELIKIKTINMKKYIRQEPLHFLVLKTAVEYWEFSQGIDT